MKLYRFGCVIEGTYTPRGGYHPLCLGQEDWSPGLVGAGRGFAAFFRSPRHNQPKLSRTDLRHTPVKFSEHLLDNHSQSVVWFPNNYRERRLGRGLGVDLARLVEQLTLTN